ncbi:MAG: hypothetical protein IPL91_15080 [Hyphomicrobium sp.]|nr:hypothetical protein [Hyphomicrobium sp.]
MQVFPPGFMRHIAAWIGVAAVVLIVIAAMAFGGRPTAQQEANRQAERLSKLYDKLHGRK